MFPMSSLKIILMLYNDRTYCASPKCENKCGRMLTSENKKELQGILDNTGFYPHVAYAYFCGRADLFYEPQKSLIQDS